MPTATLNTHLDAVMPTWAVREIHQRVIAAPLETTWAAVQAVTPREVRLLGPFMELRTLPARLVGASPDMKTSATDLPLLAMFDDWGFCDLGSVPLGAGGTSAEVVMGGIGKFWSMSDEAVVPLDGLLSFQNFEEPGFARTAFNLCVRPHPQGSVVTTETRVDGTDARARRIFRAYWTVIRPGSGLIRRSWLNAIRRRALA